MVFFSFYCFFVLCSFLSGSIVSLKKLQSIKLLNLTLKTFSSIPCLVVAILCSHLALTARSESFSVFSFRKLLFKSYIPFYLFLPLFFCSLFSDQCFSRHFLESCFLIVILIIFKVYHYSRFFSENYFCNIGFVEERS